MYTLGINAVFHDSAAVLVKDGITVAAAEEERFTGVKHGKRPVPFSTYELPFHAIDYCLRQEGITFAGIDHVAYSFDPYLLLGERSNDTAITLPLEPSRMHPAVSWQSPWEGLFLSSVVNAPRQLADGAPFHLQERFVKPEKDVSYRWHFVDHHAAHAASAYFPSPFSSAAVLTLDGRGEESTTSYYAGQGAQLAPLAAVRLPHSLGLLYEQVTSYLGFLHSSDEYKVMALASYGKPSFVNGFREIVQPAGNGAYTVNGSRLEERFGPVRRRGAPIEQRHYDIAHSLQTVIEETVLELVSWLHAKTGEDNLCLAGGVALNCVLNARIRDRGPFKRVWVQPAAGDAGTALGAALHVDIAERENKGDAGRKYLMEHVFLGPEYSDEEIERFLRRARLAYRKLEDVPSVTADLLAQDKVIGWFQGRMEFGPRALGGRSILASPLHASMQSRLNDIKDREDFRPVAPVVIEEEAAAWFKGADVSPFMLFVYDVLPDKAGAIPAVRHCDGTARVQTVRRDQHPLYYDLLRRFKTRTGVPVLVNTSFNTRGKPIVCSPRDAVECFWTSPIDALVIGPFLLEKRP